jgi:hypothetical protein
MKGQLTMSYPETQAALGRRQTIQHVQHIKLKKMYNTDPTKKLRMNAGACKL